jgi:predicted anti-sigma-YlaC factor YlaD
MGADLSCIEIVELVNDYLEGTLARHDRVRFEEHLGVCPGCAAYVDQMRTTVRLTGRLRADELTSDVRAQLVEAFRGYRAGSPG